MGDFFESRSNSIYSNYLVCENHVHSHALTNIFRKHGRPYGECAICRKVVTEWDFENPFFIEFEVLFQKMKKCVEFEFGDTGEILPYDSEEKELIGQSWTTRELIEDLCEDSCDEELVEWIIDAFGETEVWAYRETFSDFDESEELYYTWSFFSDLVKYKVRYLFSDSEEKRSDVGLNYPIEILNKIGEYISNEKLFVTFPERLGALTLNLVTYRARSHKEGEVNSYKDICSPPRKAAKSNRFSPEGIPMFYGAECPKTAIKEVINSDFETEFISVAEFSSNQPLTFVDLRSPKVYDFFDLDNIQKRHASIFINRFVEEITKPIDYKNQIDSIEYIPSQIVTEYFRFILSKQRHKIDGIAYKSSKNPNKDCFVIFADSESCSEEGQATDDHLLFMKKNSIVTKRVKDLKID